ncbi:MAG: Na(+)-translocating NADH-quinone reductase subunit C [Gammaproteobacteria bacterium]
MAEFSQKTSNPEPINNKKNKRKGLLSLPNDDKRKIIFVATLLSLVSSILVSTAAIKLRPLQESNAQYFRKFEILKVAGLLPVQGDMESYFSNNIQTKIVNLASGQYTKEINPETFDERKAARADSTSMALPAHQDIAGIKRRSNYMRVYLVPDQQGKPVKIILPVHGYGLWSTLYGFLALNADGRTIAGLTFYEQAETAGLGAEITNPKWLAQFPGKHAIDKQGKPVIRVNKGVVNPSSKDKNHLVDGISGATLTSNGVTNLMHFWLGELGFGPYLATLGNY